MIRNPVVGNRVYFIKWRTAIEREICIGVITEIHDDDYGLTVTLRYKESFFDLHVMHLYETEGEAIKVCIERSLSRIKAELEELEKHERLLNATN